MKVRMTGVAALLMAIAALMQVIGWIGGGHGGQALYACIGAFYAFLCWQKDCEVDDVRRRVT